MSKEFTEQDLLQSVNKQKKEMFKKQSKKGFGVTNSIATTITIKDSASTEKEESNQGGTLEEPKAETNTPGYIQIDQAQLVSLIAQALEPVKAENAATKQEVEKIKAEKEAVEKALEAAKNELAATKEKLAETSKDSKVLEDLGKLAGKQLAGETNRPLTVLGEGSQEMRNYEKLLNSAESRMVQTGIGLVRQTDNREAKNYWVKNQKAISEGVEAVLKQAGFLQGNGRITNAPTLVSDIPSIAFTHLSNYIRESTYDDLIHAQFFTSGFSPGTDVGLNTAIPNYPYIAKPTTVASRQLDPANRITTDTDPVTQRNITITIEELGLGKDTNARPLSITNFVKAFSIQELEALVMRNLGRDYQAYIDLRAWSLWFTATTIGYPTQAGQLQTVAGSLTANDGVHSRNFFVNLSAFMKANKFAPFIDGYYGFAHNPGSWAQYINTLTPNERYVSDEMTDIVSKAMQKFNAFGGVVSGLRGVHGGFVHFEHNAYGVGSVGSPGVNSVTVATVATTFDSSFAFGGETIGRSVALDVEMRKNEVSNYGRFDDYIWYSHEGFAEMNINADAPTGRERRVIQVRNRRTI